MLIEQAADSFKLLFDADAPHGVYAEPPWARVVPVDGTTLEPVPDGEIGLAIAAQQRQEVGHVHERAQDLFRDAVAEVILVRTCTQTNERKNGDRRSVTIRIRPL